ncbi:MAG: ATP-binding cassette domain-containing protein [Bdellovibrionales bacterium]|nr:ATP-binding cassette domain-containing protein [Bdellovibrionales bacterium]
MSEAALSISGFESVFELSSGRFVVRADFAVDAGERVALHSPSGSGKSTLLRWIAGVEDAPAAGTLRLGGREIGNLPPERREIGVVFQDYALFPQLSALENVAFGLEMRGASSADRKARALEWLDRLGLKARAELPAGLLSGGEKQRVALARALIWEPKALLLDEPFAALDLAHRKNAREVVKTLLEKSPVPTLFVTHDPEDVAALATRTLAYSSRDDGMTHFFGQL